MVENGSVFGIGPSHAQNVDSLHGHSHGDQDTEGKTLEVGEVVNYVTDHNPNSGPVLDPGEGW
jgi:hypothetical protein